MSQKNNHDYLKIKSEVFARRLAEVIYSNNLTQAQLSRDTGIDEGVLSRYMSGQKLPNLKTVYTISRYIGVSIDYLVGNERWVLDKVDEIRDMYSLERDDKSRRLMEKLDTIERDCQGIKG